jgi:hypothetical protein
MSTKSHQEKCKRLKKAAVVEAPTFDAARLELYECLKSWVFARVCRPCTVPADSRQIVEGEEIITYYHGIAAVINGGLAVESSSELNRIWFKKPACMNYNNGQVRETRRERVVKIGPVSIVAPDDKFFPKAGDVLMGKTFTEFNKKRKLVSHPGRVAGNSDASTQHVKFTCWYPFAGPLALLFSLVCNGTSVSENDLRKELNVRYLKRRGSKPGDDDVWALARLVLFGNVRAFADEHLRLVQVGTVDSPRSQNEGVSQNPMNLSCPPLEFVCCCSEFLKDNSLWDKFAELVPGATKPESVDSDDSSYLSENDEDGINTVTSIIKPLAIKALKPVPNSTSSVQREGGVNVSTAHPFLHAIGNRQHNFNYGYGSTTRNAYEKDCLGYGSTSPGNRSSAYDPTSPRPVSPAYNPTSPRPGSPAYNPTSPRPGSPAYNPTSPRPASPAYNPTSPRPASPAYNPTSPRPASPAYNPTSPRPASPAYSATSQSGGSRDSVVNTEGGADSILFGLPPLPLVAAPPLPVDPPGVALSDLTGGSNSSLFYVGDVATECDSSDKKSLNTDSLLEILRNVAAIKSASGLARL